MADDQHQPGSAGVILVIAFFSVGIGEIMNELERQSVGLRR